MANEFYTLIIVPHAKARFRKVQVPVRFAKWAAGVSGALFLVVSAMLVHYMWISAEVSELVRLRSENGALVERTRQYELSVGRLQAKVTGLQKLVDKLGVMAGLESSLPDPGPSTGVGGVPSADTAAPSLDPSFVLRNMDERLEGLKQRSTKLETFYKDRSLLLASTPSIWPVRGYFASNFGSRTDPFTNQRDFHPGIDISAPSGTRIHAPADGVVVHAGDKGGYGRCIMIDHGYGMVTRYGHLERYNVKPGQRVRRGDVIGFVGNTGRSVAPHLHYEVWVHDKLHNPIDYILDEYKSFG